MKKLAYISFFLLLSTALFAQKPALSAGTLRLLKTKEDSLANLARLVAVDTLTQDRMKADSFFTRVLVRSLQVKHSFYFPFSNVKGISALYAPDSSFRIFTWNLQIDEYYSRQRGAIQMKTADGSLRLYPLRDVSEFTDNAADSARTAANWIGAVYYNIIKTEYQGRNYYTLFGIDFHSIRSTKKWIEVLRFNDRGEPVFGGEMFAFSSDSLRHRSPHRVQLEFKKDARVLANYIPDLGLILIDHLISESEEPDNPWTLIPDGDNEAFKWEKGKWVHIDKAFDYEVDMSGTDPYLGNPPLEAPILDKKGNVNQKKLEEQSQKNKKKNDPVQ